MHKIYIAGILILVLGAFFLHYQNSRLREKVQILQNDKDDLEQQLEDYEDAISKYEKAQETAAAKIAEVRAAARVVKSDDDCYEHNLPADVRKLLNGA